MLEFGEIKRTLCSGKFVNEVSDDNSLIEVKIGALIMDPNTNTPIVVLKGVES
jgi:hypothetical protein